MWIYQTQTCSLLQFHHMVETYSCFQSLNQQRTFAFPLCATCRNGFHPKIVKRCNLITAPSVLKYKQSSGLQTTPPVGRPVALQRRFVKKLCSRSPTCFSLYVRSRTAASYFPRRRACVSQPSVTQISTPWLSSYWVKSQWLQVMERLEICICSHPGNHFKRRLKRQDVKLNVASVQLNNTDVTSTRQTFPSSSSFHLLPIFRQCPTHTVIVPIYRNPSSPARHWSALAVVT